MIQLLVDLQWAIWTKGAWTEKDLSYSCYFGRHCLGINNGVSYSCIHSKKNTRKTRKYGSCSKVSKQNSKEPWIFVGKLCSCFLGRFVCRRNCTLQVSWSNQNIQQSNTRFWRHFRIPPKEMDQFPYSLFVLEHIFLCPLFISIFIGFVILYQHGKVLKRSLMQRWNILPFTKFGPYLLSLMTTNIWWLSKNKLKWAFWSSLIWHTKWWTHESASCQESICFPHLAIYF